MWRRIDLVWTQDPRTRHANSHRCENLQPYIISVSYDRIGRWACFCRYYSVNIWRENAYRCIIIIIIIQLSLFFLGIFKFIARVFSEIVIPVCLKGC
jgi:hypothetical protein